MTDNVFPECCLCKVELTVGDAGGALVLLTEDEPGAEMEMGQPVIYSGGIPYYEGPYEATPGPETQVMPTSGKAMRGNFRINPIPSNYGLITYHANIITVS